MTLDQGMLLSFWRWARNSFCEGAAAKTTLTFPLFRINRFMASATSFAAVRPIASLVGNTLISNEREKVDFHLFIPPPENAGAGQGAFPCLGRPFISIPFFYFSSSRRFISNHNYPHSYSTLTFIGRGTAGYCGRLRIKLTWGCGTVNSKRSMIQLQFLLDTPSSF
jgi:hypothetical protein